MMGWGGFPAPVPATDDRNTGGLKPPEAKAAVVETHRPSMAAIEKLLDNPNLTPEQKEGYRAILSKMGVKPNG